MIQKLLEVRKRLKSRKPVFIRQDTSKRMKLKIKWKKPKGVHSKIRHKMRGRSKMPSTGYMSPALVRGLHASGLKMMMVNSAKELEKINNKSEGIVVSGNVGAKKRLEILKKANAKNITVLNYDSASQIKKIEDIFASKKAKKQEEKKPEAKPENKPEGKPEEKPEAKQPEKKDAEEDKKDAESKEKERVLTKRI